MKRCIGWLKKMFGNLTYEAVDLVMNTDLMDPWL